jgi:hypothetical protein
VQADPGSPDFEGVAEIEAGYSCALELAGDTDEDLISTAALIWNLRHKSLSTKDLCTHAWCLHLELRRRLMCHKF